MSDNIVLLKRLNQIVKYNSMRDFYREKSLLQEKKYSDSIQNYNEILDKTIMLANELSLTSSLEISILFSYLLWNGYFSKNKEYNFKINGKKNHYLPSLDIMNGGGVCLNNSSMLKDLINKTEYKSIILLNNMDKTVKGYIPNIERKNENSKLSILKYKFLNSLEISKSSANHAFNLINENDKLYIYDSTGLMMYKIINKEAEIISGSSNVKLCIYDSKIYSKNEADDEMLDSINYISGCPYTKEDFINTFDNSLALLEDNSYLLNDFFLSIYPNIEIVVNDQKIKRK